MKLIWSLDIFEIFTDKVAVVNFSLGMETYSNTGATLDLSKIRLQFIISKEAPCP